MLWTSEEDMSAELIPVELPKSVQQQCLAITKAFMLEWTAIDWRLSQRMNMCFLEANPSPMFLHFEHQTSFRSHNNCWASDELASRECSTNQCVCWYFNRVRCNLPISEYYKKRRSSEFLSLFSNWWGFSLQHPFAITQ